MARFSALASRTRLVTALAGAALLSACATATTYHPATGSGFARTGFSDEQIEQNRFRVSFSGNSYTSRDTVERYLLFRAAELTISTGADYFIMVDRDTDKQTRTYASPSFGGYSGFGYWGPSWRYRGRGFGWRTWDPFWGSPFWDRSVDVTTVDRYEAAAEIVTGHGPKPTDNVRAFDARAVVDRLGPQIQFPEQRK
jgi:hypothetical protein